MRTYSKIFAVLLMAMMTVSCMVDRGSSSTRTRQRIIEFSYGVYCNSVYSPAAAVAVAMDAALYFSHVGDETFDVDSLYPDGIRHLDESSIYVVGVGNVYSNDSDFYTPGSVWRLDLGYLQSYNSYFANYSETFQSDYNVTCIGNNTWTVTLDSEEGESYTEPATVTFSLSDEDTRVYIVKTTGKFVEDGGYCTEYTTEDEGVSMVHMTDEDKDKDKELENRWRYSLNMFRAVSGRYETRMYRYDEILDYCYMTFNDGDVSYSVSIR